MKFTPSITLRGIAAAAILAMAPALFTATPAASENCNEYAEGSRAQDACLFRNAKRMHRLNREYHAECARGGCGRKANAINRNRNRVKENFQADQ